MIIKIIDLFNKIADGEELPKKIKFMNSIWEYERDGYVQDFQNEIGHCLMEFVPINKNGLNEEIEIIEEDKKISFEKIEELTCSAYDFEKQTINSLIKNQKRLIDEINKLKEE